MKTDRRYRGMVILYAAVFMTAVMAVISLAVDWGRVQTAKTELQDAADAAARYAVQGIADGTAFSKASSSAGENRVDGSVLALQAGDVEQGIWNPVARTFTVSASNKNAVRITGRRTTARGNAVPLLFGQAIGRNSVDVTATSVATLASTDFGIIAINSLNMSSGTRIQPAVGETGTTSVACNGGTYAVNGTAQIIGDAYYRTTVPSGTVTGSKILMSSNIACAPVAMPNGVTPVNYTLSSGTFSAGGTFYASQLSLGGTLTLSLTANTVIYCSGNANFGSGFRMYANGYKLTIYMTSGSGVTMNNTNMMTATIYAPSSPMNMNSSGGFTGTLVVSSLNLSNGTIHYSSTQPIPIDPTGGGGGVSGVKTVKSVPITVP